MISLTRRLLCFVLVCAAVTGIAAAQAQSPSAVPAPATPATPAANTHTVAQPFDINAAVEAYLAKMPPEQRQRNFCGDRQAHSPAAHSQQ